MIILVIADLEMLVLDKTKLEKSLGCSMLSIRKRQLFQSLFRWKMFIK